MRIAVLSNKFEQFQNKEVEEDLVETANSVKDALESFGHSVTIYDVNERTFELLRNSNHDFAFNVCERYQGNSLFEPHVAAMLELCNLRYTGSGPLALSLCMNKVRVKEILTQNGIPTPRYQVFYSKNKKLSPELRFPLIVKPTCNDNSIGITNKSIVYNEKDLRSRVGFINRAYNQPALVEEFIEGREFAVGVLGTKNPVALPVSEYRFMNFPPGRPEIMSYETKWEHDFERQIGAYEKCPAEIPKYLEAKMKRYALEATRILEVRDYSRIDIRLSRDGIPYVLEMNPNPGISADNTIPKAAVSLGLSYDEMVHEILISALERHGIAYSHRSKVSTNTQVKVLWNELNIIEDKEVEVPLK